MSERHTVTLRHDTYTQLRNYGKFGESFSDLVSRILEEIGTKNRGESHN